MAATLTFLGTGDAMGVPRVYCDCPVCTEARTSGRNRRRRPSALVRDGGGCLLIDCGPDWRLQMESVGLRAVDAVLVTHPHHDHIGGLPELADAVRWTGRPVPVAAAPRVLAEIQARYPWIGQYLVFTPLIGPAEFLGFRVTAWEVNHGHNGRSYGLRLERPGFAWAYVPDSIHLSPAEREPLRGLDLLVLGTAYYREEAPVATRSLYDMVEALALLAEVRPRRAIFTHLSHGVDLREPYPLPPEVTLAEDGMTVPLA
ncbi:MAG: MBL fold metallo-hydrolase [Firmicutes bacterium]|nr:MBL fold metallo-hydrolase [Bacillota bacterium]